METKPTDAANKIREYHLKSIGKCANSQLQQRQISVAVKRPVLALLRHIVLEDCRGLRVISIEAVENGVDVSRSGLALVEGDTHFVLSVMCGREQKGESVKRMEEWSGVSE